VRARAGQASCVASSVRVIIETPHVGVNQTLVGVTHTHKKTQVAEVLITP